MIEDEADVRDTTASLLERAGFTVLCAKDAAEACKIWDNDQSSIEMMIADVVLSGRTGPEIAVQFRKHQPSLKVIFTTRIDRRTRLETEHLVRGAKFIRKPISAKTLIETVRSEFGAQATH